MSMHKIPLTDMEYNGLIAHGFDVHKPSQLSDAFRLGVAWVLSQTTQIDYASLDPIQRLAVCRGEPIPPSEVQESKVNQCDGCQAGIPLINGTHRMGEPDGYANKIKCTADLYK